MKPQINFQHDDKNIYASCGIGRAEFEETIDKISSITDYCAELQQQNDGHISTSQVMEQYLAQLTERQLFVYFIIMLVNEIAVSDDDEDEDQDIKPGDKNQQKIV